MVARGLAQPGPDQLCILGGARITQIIAESCEDPDHRRILRGALFSHAPDPLLDREPVCARSREERLCHVPDPLVNREPL